MEKVTKVRFALKDTLEGLHEEIVNVLPEIKTEWTQHFEDETNKPYFMCEVGRVGVEVHETYAIFTLYYKDDQKQEKRKFQKIQKVGKIQKPLKLNIYGILMKRFGDEEEFSFYKRVLRSMNGQLNKQKERHEITFTEDADSGEIDSYN
jgi:hypothetical protein